jgi:hypothetical protein
VVVEDWVSRGVFGALDFVRVTPMPTEEQGFVFPIFAVVSCLICVRGSRVSARSGAVSRLFADAHDFVALPLTSVSFD